MTSRRQFITLLGGAAAAWPGEVWGQQPATPVIGYLSPGAPQTTDLAAFRQGLAEAGFFESQNVAIEYRFAAGKSDRLSALAADLVHRGVNVIAVTGGSAALAAKSATTTVPIIFYVGVDPIETGLVASLSRPAGNLTGITNLNVDLGQKRLELLHELVPKAATITLLVNPTNPSTPALSKELSLAAHTLGRQVHILYASTAADIDTAIADARRLPAGALMIGANAFFNTRSEQLGALTVSHALPAIYQFREFVAAGGLMSYGGNIADGFRIAGVYTGRILKGEKPSDLPVQRFTKVELIINLKTAKALGITIPITLLGRADEVIE
jgi:putative ABC transport system substrate-binding protein